MTQPTTPSQYQGTSNPPNGGDVTDVSTPESNDQTVVDATGPNTPPSQPQTPVANIPTPGGAAPTQGPQTPGQPQGPPGQPGGLQGSLPKPPPPSPAQIQNAVQQAKKTQAVGKASIFHDVAETLAGGPQYNYTVDAYGNMQKTKVPVSGAHLALAIAMEALSGAATGFANGQGPGGAARAAGASFKQGQEQIQAADALKQKQASDDFARKAQTTELNMRMYSTALQAGKMDFELNTEVDKQWEPTLTNLQLKAPGFIEGPITAQEAIKIGNVTRDSLIPAKTVPRLDGSGNQVEINGIKQWNHLFYMVKPGVKLSNLFTPQDLEDAKKWGFSWGNNDRIIDSPIDLNLYMNLKSQLVQLNVADKTFQQEFDKYDSSKGGGYKIGNDVPVTGKFDDVINRESKDAGIDPRFTRALIGEESSGNPTATSPTGVKGIMQVTLATGKKYGINNDDDRDDPNKSIHAGTHYFSDLLNQFKDPKLAIAAYYSGPQAIKDGKIVDTSDHTAADTQRYVSQVTGRLGLTAQDSTEGGKPERMSLDQWTAKYPQTRNDIEAFMGAVNSPNNPNETGLYAPALNHLAQTNPQAAGNIAAFLNQGDPDFIKNHDDDLVTQAEARKAQVQTDALDQRNENKQAQDERLATITQSYLKPPTDNFTLDPTIVSMDSNDAQTALKNAGVRIPTNFGALWQVAHYKAPASILPARTWQKGAPNEMDAQTGLSYIQQFVNPGYDQKNYQTAQKIRLENASGNSKNGASIQNAGVAAQHLTLLKQAGDALAQGNIPIANSALNQLSKALGQPGLTTYEALLPIVSQEVGKVAAGGTVPYEQAVSKAESAFDQKQSPQQREAAINGVIGLMYGRIKAIDENTYDNLQEHLNNVPSEATDLFQKAGFDTPWIPQPKPPVQGAVPGYQNGKLVGWQLPNGQKVPANWKPQPSQSQQPQQPQGGDLNGISPQQPQQ